MFDGPLVGLGLLMFTVLADFSELITFSKLCLDLPCTVPPGLEDSTGLVVVVLDNVGDIGRLFRLGVLLKSHSSSKALREYELSSPSSDSGSFFTLIIPMFRTRRLTVSALCFAAIFVFAARRFAPLSFVARKLNEFEFLPWLVASL